MPEKISRLETIKRMSFNKQSSHSMPTLETDQHIPDPPIISGIKPISKSMESMDSYKVHIEDSNDETSESEESMPVPAPRRIV